MLGEMTNDTLEPMFYIFAFSISENDRIFILTAVLLIYLTILSGNLLIISLICLEPQLHTSMYFFLCNLSTLDILYVSTTLPNLIYVSHTGDHVMSYAACIAQMYLYLVFADTECFLLTAMAIDRYIAVCFPLHYSLIMSKQVCVLLAFPAWFVASMNASLVTCLVNNLTFIGLVEVKNFFCDLKALRVASFGDTISLKIFIIVDAMIIGVIVAFLILASYICIIYTVLKIKSSAGRWKTFSSCSSHITIVALYFGSAMSLYLTNSVEQDVVLSMTFVTLVPMLNPLVYSLRNKDIVQAIRKLLHTKITH
ncbi:olfactory receptor 1496-like [Hyla sarda]|uniref:olfactory receptor 1496-like n=1 Tax=Hyla sarda TaxID=327740 RepID=UPI0024C453B6|nr:olfactory receptor 1496-like [Hyla sarda]